VVYSGRLTFQKNVLRLISEFSRVNDSRAHLFLAGHIDHMGGPFQPAFAPGLFYMQFTELMDGLPNEIRQRVRCLGHLDHARLRALYNAADLFASLSTFHDEDYGMAPIEALFCGCPALLTDWAGYAGFDQKEGSIRYVRVHIDDHGLYLKSQDIIEGMQERLEQGPNPANRLERSRLFQSRFSPSAIGAHLRRLHAQPPPMFTGYLPHADEFTKRFHRPNGPFSDGMGKNSFYFKAYKSYLGL
jgi:glycosyltransferase involved in cell wall biosynthesis